MRAIARGTRSLCVAIPGGATGLYRHNGAFPVAYRAGVTVCSQSGGGEPAKPAHRY